MNLKRALPATILFLLFSTAAIGLPDYSIETNQACEHCHVSPEGGGELTSNGIDFSKTKNDTKFSLKNSLFYLTRFIHIFFAFLWFGTILYVHLILKPAYASGGLPPNEVKVGVISMVVIGITGTIMTIHNFPNLSTIADSSFGIFLLIKMSVYLIMVASAIFVVTAIGPKLHAATSTNAKSDEEGMTLSDLKKYDGTNGNPAYIAYDGKIYDVSESKRWKGGVHFKQHNAGTDLSESLSRAPHSEEKLAKYPVVNRLASSTDPEKNKYKHIFYSLAYGNLAFVITILTILTIWKK